jgi:hypothetical protein
MPARREPPNMQAKQVHPIHTPTHTCTNTCRTVQTVLPEGHATGFNEPVYVELTYASLLRSQRQCPSFRESLMLVTPAFNPKVNQSASMHIRLAAGPVIGLCQVGCLGEVLSEVSSSPKGSSFTVPTEQAAASPLAALLKLRAGEPLASIATPMRLHQPVQPRWFRQQAVLESGPRSCQRQLTKAQAGEPDGCRVGDCHTHPCQSWRSGR